MSLSGILFFFNSTFKAEKRFQGKERRVFFEVFVEIFLDFVRVLR